MLQYTVPRGSPRILSLIAIIALAFGAALTQAQDSPRITGLKATNVTHDSITITWDLPPESVFVYDFFLKGDDRDWLAGGGATDYTFTGLQPQKKYNIRVRYVPDDPTKGATKWSRKISVWTDVYVPPPTPVPTPAPPPVGDLSVRVAYPAEVCPGYNYKSSNWYSLHFVPAPNAVLHYIYMYTNLSPYPRSSRITADSDYWYNCSVFMPEPGVTVYIDVEAINADGYVIAAGSVTAPYPKD